jgi:mycothiol synthase
MPTGDPRLFAGETDLPRLAELISACQAVDRLEAPPTLQDLREGLLEPAPRWRREATVWDTGSGLTAFSCLWVSPESEKADTYLWLVVLPSARTGDLTRAVLARADERAAALAGGDATLTIGAGDDEGWLLAVVPAFGFTPVRYFLEMTRHLDTSLPTAAPPAGYRIRPLVGPEEVDAWVDLYNTAFADHWEHHDLTPEERRQDVERASYRADLDLVTVAPDGTLAAFCWCSIRDRNDAGDVDAWINLVGTHPAHRRRGLARAVLVAGMVALRDAGMTQAKLGVDSENPSDATSLYRKLGFQDAKTITVFRRPVRSVGERTAAPGR